MIKKMALWCYRFGYVLVGCLLFSAFASAQISMTPIQVSEHCYYVKGFSEIGSAKNQNFISNAGIIIAPQGVIVVDALGSPSAAKILIAEIGKLTSKPITHVILTHYHADHIYGLQEFKAIGAKVIAHQLGRNYLVSDTAVNRLEASKKELAPWIDVSTKLIVADEWIDHDMQQSFSGMELVLKHVGPAHTPEDLAVLVPSEKVLFVGDLVFSGRIPYVGNANTKGWIHSLEELRKMDVKVIVAGHGEASFNPQKDLDFIENYLKFLRTSMYQPARDMDAFDEAYSKVDWSRYTSYPLFKSANRMNAYNVYLSIQNE